MQIAGFDVVALAAAVALAAIGGEAFLRAIIGLSSWLRVPEALVATTVVAFATSSPELTVATVAALAGQPQVGLGDALGSNVFNIAFIFGIALWFGPIRSQRADFRGNFRLALLVPLLTLLLGWDGQLARDEGLLLLLVYAGWLGLSVRAGWQQRRLALGAPQAAPPPRVLVALGQGALGLGALVLAGRLFVGGATGIAAAIGVTSYVIGALVVAFGTSLPELVTVVLSRLRGKDDVGVGTLIGSNLFNGLTIVGVAATIHPVTFPLQEMVVTLACGMAALLCLPPDRFGLIPRWRALLLLGIYAIFVWLTLAAGG